MFAALFALSSIVASAFGTPTMAEEDAPAPAAAAPPSSPPPVTLRVGRLPLPPLEPATRGGEGVRVCESCVFVAVGAHLRSFWFFTV
jgi:hypothetical protein